MAAGTFKRHVENHFHLLEDLIKERFIAGSMRLRIFDRVAMPDAQIVVAKDALVVVDKGKVGTVVFRVIEDVDESLGAQFDPNCEAIPPFFGDGKDNMRKNIRSCLSNPILKLSEFLVRIHDLWSWFGLVKFSHRRQKVFFLHLPSFPLHKVTFDLMRMLVWDFVFLPGLNEVSKGKPIFRFKAAQLFVTCANLVLQVFSRQVFQLRFQIDSWSEVFKDADKFVAEGYSLHELPRAQKPRGCLRTSQETTERCEVPRVW